MARPGKAQIFDSLNFSPGNFKQERKARHQL